MAEVVRESILTLLAEEEEVQTPAILMQIQFLEKDLVRLESPSSLAQEVAAFPFRSILSSQLEGLVSHIHEDSPDFKIVFDLLTSYTSRMMTLHQQNNTAEVEYVQQPTFQLMTDISASLLADYIEGIYISCRKASDTPISLRYSRELDLKGKYLDINGEADLCIKYCEVPVFVLEVQTLSATCDSPIEKGEVLAESKGFAEEFCTKMHAAPLDFPSLLVSGKCFVFVRRIVAENGNAVYLLSRPIETFNDSYSTHLRNLKLVSKEIVRIFGTIKGLIQEVRQMNVEDRHGGGVVVSTFDDDHDFDRKGIKGSKHSSGKSSFQTTATTGNGGDATKRRYITTSIKAPLLTERNLQKHDQRLFFM
eukprot:gene24713-32190_t